MNKNIKIEGKTIMHECAYCEEYKEAVVWRETGEWVCYDCRLEFLNEEFGKE